MCVVLRCGQPTECRFKSVHMCFPRSPAVVVVRGAGSSAPAASPEEQAQRAAGKSAHAAEHEQHEAWAHSQVSGGGGGFHICNSIQTTIQDSELIRGSHQVPSLKPVA